MVGIGIRFDLGRYHATPWAANVNDATVEWPPSPWRLIRALYATGRTHVGLARRQADVDRVLTELIRSGPPTFRLPPAAAAHTRHYMPRTNYSFTSPGNTSKVLDGFLALDPAAMVEVWWNHELDHDERAVLSALAGALPYVGRSESVCSATVLDEAPQAEPDALPLAQATGNGDYEVVDLLCVDPDQPLDTVSMSVTELRRRRLRLPPGARRVRYAVRLQAPAATAHERRSALARPEIAVFRLRGGDRPAMTEAVMVGQVLRKAIQCRYGEGNERQASPTFSGHAGDRPRNDQHQHAHYFSTPDRHSKRIDRLVVWAPEGFGPAELEALERVTFLKFPGYPNPTPCALVAVGNPDTLEPLPIAGRSRRWRSLTPFGLVRHPKRRRGEIVDSPVDQVLAELRCRERFPEVEDVRLVKGPWHRYRSSKVGNTRLERARLYGVEIEFAEVVEGPVAIGALCHYGLGLFEPFT